MKRLACQGFSLLLPAVLLLVLATILLATAASQGEQRNRARSARSLAIAREALLGYATAYPELHRRGTPPRDAHVPGHLPCPDTGFGQSGQEAPNCGARGISVRGRLPWKSLGVSPLRDGSGECLWYVVSGNYKNNPKWPLLNPDQAGLLRVVDASGRTVVTGAAALVIAPGAPLAGQQRMPDNGLCSEDGDAEHYLEQQLVLSSEVGGISTLTLNAAADDSNDRYIWITPQDIFTNRFGSAASTRLALFDPDHPTGGTPALAQRTADCLARFALANPYRRLPWAAPLQLADAGADTFSGDRFDDQKNLLAGRVPQIVRDSFRSVGTLDLASFADCSASTPSACRLLRTDNCPDFLPAAGYPTPSDAGTASKDSPDGWWDKWKDHLFYAVAADFAPAATPAGNCSDPGRCLWVAGNGPYAAIVVHAGAPLSGQQRDDDTMRMQIGNYLEGDNATAFTAANGLFAHAGNDQIVCIRTDLSLDPACGSGHCPAAAAAFLAQAEATGCAGLAQTACLSARDTLAGCACYGDAEEFAAQACAAASTRRSCRRALGRLRGCRS